MNLVNFPNGACQKVVPYLDSYINNELEAETRTEVSRHLEVCPECTREVEVLTKLKSRVRQAATQSDVPADLPLRIQSAILDYEQRNVAARTRYWLMSAAAVVLLAFGAWRASTLSNSSVQLARFLRVGVTDHEECAVPRTYAEAPPSWAQMEWDLGPRFQDFLPVVRSQMPSEYRLEQAHQCTVGGRKYVHFIFRNAPSLVSFIVTKKAAADSFPERARAIDEMQVDQYQAAGGETPEYLFYVVSNTPPAQNRHYAEAFSAPLREYLTTHTAALPLKYNAQHGNGTPNVFDRARGPADFGSR